MYLYMYVYMYMYQTQMHIHTHTYAHTHKKSGTAVHKILKRHTHNTVQFKICSVN